MNYKAVAYPLSWPPGWPRTEANRRESGAFKTNLSAAMKNLRDELRLLGAKEVVLSSNVTLGQEHPKDTGVAVYFIFENEAACIPCDRWLRVESNVQAIAKTIEAMRGIQRWGAKHMVKAAFRGFVALPAPSSAAKNCWTVLDLAPGASRFAVEEQHRHLSQVRHPDRGGSHDEMVALNRAREEALAIAR